MAHGKTQKPILALPSPPSSAQKWKYDVFLSFRGEDTRKTFVSHIHTALLHKGIITFKDNCELESGKTISQELLKAIKYSRILVVIFSRTYASSTWCLDELARISECMRSSSGKQTVLPVFYDVDPSEVRKQSGMYGRFFAEHELGGRDRRTVEKVQRWRDAMTEVGSLSGWDIQKRLESEAIQEIVEKILTKLRKSSNKLSTMINSFIGMDSRMKELDLYLDIGQLNDVHIVGICGMGGIGKTTIARVVYEKLSCQFEGSSFLANVREVQEKHGLVFLQEQLLSQNLMQRSITIRDTYEGIAEIRKTLNHKKVLVVLDDVNHMDQLRSLVGMRDWFGSGSRIIITTRDEHMLISHGVDKIYKVEGLNHEEALHLFCLKAFKIAYCEDYDYWEFANCFVDYANGLPLAIDILGSFLFGRSVDEWRSALDRLKEIPNKEIMDKLYISFDGLEEVEKKIFLDIACFFKGDEEDYVKKVLKSCGFYPDIGIRVLIDKSLITISNGKVWMHDLLQDMGREIVRRESYEEPGKRSRLWLYKDFSQIMLNNTGTEHVEGIVLDLQEQGDEKLSAKAFTKMRRLRLLKIQGLQFSSRLEFISNELRYVEWTGYPFKCLPSAFLPDKLVELHMQYSNIQHLWSGIKALKMLKVIDLRHSENLIKIMDFKQVPNLEELNLEGCLRLSEVHQSIGTLKRLKFLNLKNCKGLVRLPSSICDLKSLKVLNLHGCSKLDKLPERLGEITCLEKLSVGGITGAQFSSSSKIWDFLFWLRFSSRGNNPNPMALMFPSLSVLCSLKTLDLSDCHLKEGVIPNDLSCFPQLEELRLSGNDIVTIPTSIICLSKLEDLRISNCKRLQSLPNLPSSILYLSLDGCTSLDTSLPKSITISRDFKLENLCVTNCMRLHSVPDLSSSVIQISFEGFASSDGFSKNPFEQHTSKPSTLTFINCLKLIEIQGFQSTVFARLTSYLHYLLKHSRQGFFNPRSHVTMCFSGGEVPHWFSYQGIGSLLELQLPLHWFTNKWLGFAVCVVFEAHESLSEACTIFCDLQACMKSNQFVFLGRTPTQISKDMCIASEQLLFNFIPHNSLNCVDWRDVHGQLNASFFSDRGMLKVKYCGFRILYDHDVNELLPCNRLHENMSLQCDGNFATNKRSHDDYDSGGALEVNENGNFNKEFHSKRFKLHTDSKLKLDQSSNIH